MSITNRFIQKNTMFNLKRLFYIILTLVYLIVYLGVEFVALFKKYDYTHIKHAVIYILSFLKYVDTFLYIILLISQIPFVLLVLNALVLLFLSYIIPLIPVEKRIKQILGGYMLKIKHEKSLIFQMSIFSGLFSCFFNIFFILLRQYNILLLSATYGNRLFLILTLFYIPQFITSILMLHFYSSSFLDNFLLSIKRDMNYVAYTLINMKTDTQQRELFIPVKQIEDYIKMDNRNLKKEQEIIQRIENCFLDIFSGSGFTDYISKSRERGETDLPDIGVTFEKETINNNEYFVLKIGISEERVELIKRIQAEIIKYVLITKIY
ncbi:MAG: hypothetical protein K9W46_04490 [Candidatus Heimdallarchaeum endolithica]|uniref:Uncharacterized protein n=1 Tax=Candidatus Heimdallarchaeum endolithica TaxID=2876572 RepID=A0A9Y1FP44_9ARCH|nr:MAG: hypothetical protein K9W46_04490 [Candidatus Heimdallarchaeum endolithica]